MAYVPRTSTTSPTPMQNNPWWYSTGNKYYPNYPLPNCTCYCYGRVGEFMGAFDTRVPNGNGGEWYPNAVAAGELQVGQVPQLGAIACYYDPSGVYLGHVSIVEEVDENWRIRTSNSGYPDTYFWYTDWLSYDDGYLENWMIQRGYEFQGFIYPYDTPPEPGPPVGRRKHLPIWMMLRYGY